jgi:hypothetical protein
MATNYIPMALTERQVEVLLDIAEHTNWIGGYHDDKRRKEIMETVRRAKRDHQRISAKYIKKFNEVITQPERKI